MTVNKVDLRGKWIGDTLGTHRCNAFVQFSEQDNKYFLELKVASVLSGGTSSFYGEVPNILLEKNEKITINITEYNNGQSTSVTGLVQLTVIEEDILDGDWETIIGAKGIIRLSRIKPSQPLVNRQEPVEIITKEYKVGSLKIYKNDIIEIIKLLKEMVGSLGFVAVTEESDGIKKTNFSEKFLDKFSKSDQPHQFDSLTINAQKNIDGLTNSLVINLHKKGESTTYVQSTDVQSTNTHLAVKEILEKRSNKIVDFYRKHGLTFNGLLFLLLLAFLPDFNLKTRLFVIGGFLFFALWHSHIHKTASLSIISAIKNAPSNFKERYPGADYIIKTLGGVIVAIIASIIAASLQSNWQIILGWLKHLFT